MRRLVAAWLVAARCAPAATSTGARDACAFDCVDAGGSTLDGQGTPVSALARSFLVPSRPRPPYVFHAYLYFAELGANSTRIPAATAVLPLFERAKPIASDRAMRLAVLYVPIASEAAARGLARRLRPEALVAQYDYDRALAIRQHVEATTKTSLPRIALLGHPGPLEDPHAVDLEQLYIVDLVGLSANEIEAKLDVVHDALVSPNDRIDVPVPSWTVEHSRSGFELIHVPRRP
jgi:hypothetical protein